MSTQNNAEVILETKNLTKSFGGVVPTNDVNIKIYKNQIRCIIGPNGAGKSTFFNLISGYLKPTSGEVWFMGEKISGLKPNVICKKGIGRKFQVPNVFIDMTAEENLYLASDGKKPFFSNIRRPSSENQERVDEILTYINLIDKKDVLAGELSHGQKQWLEIGMVLINEPILLLLDEPTAGMSAEETYKTADLIKDISKTYTVAVVEHDIGFIRNLAEEENAMVSVLDQGRLLVEGDLETVANDKRVKESYLGRREL